MYRSGIFWTSTPPCGVQRSFYGKAKTGYKYLDKKHKLAEYYLESYDTIVCKITINNEFQKVWNGYSHTTMRHINAFRRYFGLPDMKKSDWCDMKCATNDV